MSLINSGVTSGFTAFETAATQTGAKPVAGDFNGDGKTDIALTGGSGWATIPIAFSNGDGTIHGTDAGMTQGLTAFPQYASEENVKPVAR